MQEKVQLKEKLKSVLYKLCKKDHLCVFREAVDKNDAPDYYDVIKHPMDLGTMGKKVENLEYSMLGEFERDFEQMIANCKEYNNLSTVYYHQAIVLEEYGKSIFEKMKKVVVHVHHGKDPKGMTKLFVPPRFIFHKTDKRVEPEVYGLFQILNQKVKLPYREGKYIVSSVQNGGCMVCGLANPDKQCEKCHLHYHASCLLTNRRKNESTTCSYCAKGYHKDCTLCPNNLKSVLGRLPQNSWAHLWCIYGTKYYDFITSNASDKMSTITKISCFLCDQASGAVSKCLMPGCEKKCHITCAMLSTEMIVLWQPKKCFLYCKEHCPTELQIKAASPHLMLSSVPNEKCAVCNNLYETPKTQQLLQCKICRIIVHPDCYGECSLPANVNEYLCSYCSTVENPLQHPASCAVCQRSGGAFKPTTNGKWVHLYCAISIPALYFQDISTLQPVIGLESGDSSLTQSLCQLCHKKGICLECLNPTCSATYHPLCAREAKYYIIFKEKKNGSVQIFTYCNLHGQSEKEKIETTKKRSSQVPKKNKKEKKPKAEITDFNTVTSPDYWKLLFPYFDTSFFRNLDDFFLQMIYYPNQFNLDQVFQLSSLGERSRPEPNQRDLMISGYDENELDKVPQSTSNIRFRGYNFKNFNPIYQSYAFSISEDVLDWVYSHCILVDTTFRQATTDDIPFLLHINKINPGYQTTQSFLDACSEKNDFILVSERRGLHGKPYLTGMIHYYFQWFQDKTEEGKVNVLVCYVATLQAVKPETHAKYIKQYHVESESKTGVTLFSLAVEHGRKENMKYICCDSTAESVSFYLKVFNMQEHNPFPDNVYHPMGLSISDFKYWHCLPYNSSTDAAMRLKYEISSQNSINPNCSPPLPNREDLDTFYFRSNYMGEVTDNTLHYLYDRNNDDEIPILDPPNPISYQTKQISEMELVDDSTIDDKQVTMSLTEYEKIDLNEQREKETEKELSALQAELKAVILRNSRTADSLKKKMIINTQQYQKELNQDTWINKANSLYLAYTEKVREVRKIHDSILDDEQVCDVCYDDDSAFGNQIVLCDKCNVGVHQKCYNLPVIPSNDWFCMRCQQNLSLDICCFLCGQPGGAFIPTDKGRWCHASCAVFIPEITLVKVPDGLRAYTIDKIPQLRYELSCQFCKKVGHAVVQCLEPHCSVSYHVPCALKHKLEFPLTVRWTNGADSQNPVGALPYLLCKHHVDLPMPSNWDKLIFQIIRQKSKKVGVKRKASTTHKNKKRLKFDEYSSSEAEGGNEDEEDSPLQKKSSRSSRVDYGIYTDEVVWITELIEALKQQTWSQFLHTKSKIPILNHSVRGLPGIFLYHTLHTFASYELFVVTIRQLFYNYLHSDVNVEMFEPARRCKAIQIIAEIVSDHHNQYNLRHPTPVQPDVLTLSPDCPDIQPFLESLHPQTVKIEPNDQSNEPNDQSNDPSAADIENEPRDETNEIDEDDTLYCICKQKNDNGFYFECSKCGKWFHPGCLGYYICQDTTHEQPCYVTDKGQHIPGAGEMFCHICFFDTHFGNRVNENGILLPPQLQSPPNLL